MKLSINPNNKNIPNKKPINHFNTFSKVLKVDPNSGSGKQIIKPKLSKTSTQLPEAVQFKYISWNNMNELANPNDVWRNQQIMMSQKIEINEKVILLNLT